MSTSKEAEKIVEDGIDNLFKIINSNPWYPDELIFLTNLFRDRWEIPIEANPYFEAFYKKVRRLKELGHSSKHLVNLTWKEVAEPDWDLWKMAQRYAD